MPNPLFGLDVILTKSKSLKISHAFYKKIIKQIIFLPVSTVDPALYLLSGLLLINADIDTQIITFLGNILWSNKWIVE